MPALSFIATKPAGGAALDQVFIATALAGVATTILLVLVFGHRSGRIPVFARLGAVAQRVSGMRDWAALPGTVLIISLTIAVFGMYWDVGTHLDNGRDPGPLANPAQRQAEPARSRRSRPRGSHAAVRLARAAEDVPAILTTLGYLAVLALALGLLGLIVWGLMRVDRSYRDPSSGPPPERTRRPATTTTGRVAPAR
jgi:hypothetical protein